MILARRKFLIGAATTLIAAPAIVRAATLMPVKVMKEWTLAKNGLRINNGPGTTFKTVAYLYGPNGRQYRWKTFDVEPEGSLVFEEGKGIGLRVGGMREIEVDGAVAWNER
jgi:hypothetical protein